MIPKISIILTTHGDEIYLKQAIGSVLAQTFEDWELLIACDGEIPSEVSVFSFEKRLQCASFDVPDGTLCRFACTINQAFKECKGDFITYLCHDDLYLPWRLDAMVYSLWKNPDWKVCFGWQDLMEEFELLGGKEENRDFKGTRVFRDPRKGNPDQPAGTVDHSSVMHRRECFEKAGGWDENAPPRYGDAYFWARLQQAGYKFHCIPEVLDAHRFNPHSVSWKEDHPK